MPLTVQSNVDGVKFYLKIEGGKTEEYMTPQTFDFVGSYYIRVEPYPTFNHWIREYDGRERKITNYGFSSVLKEGKNVFLTACFSALPYIEPEKKLKIASPLIIGAIILFLILAFALRK